MFWFLRRRFHRRTDGGSSQYELQPAPSFLFERRRLNHRPGDSDQRGPRAVLVAGNRPPHHVTRRDGRILARGEASTLTITSDPGNALVLVGGAAQDWSVFFSAEGFGHTEAEAEEKVRLRRLQISGTSIALTGPALHDWQPDTAGELVVEAPSDSGTVIHASFSSVEVRDMSGAVRVAATHARATVLDTTGQVDAAAGCVDFAGATGKVTLTAEWEINLKMTAREFQGTLSAWAQRSVRLLVPQEWTTPVEIIVASRDKFVCRAAWASKVKHKRQGELHVFTYGATPDQIGRAGLHLRSEQSTLIIDRADGNL